MRASNQLLAFVSGCVIFAGPAFSQTVDLDCVTPASPTSFHITVDLGANTASVGGRVSAAKITDTQATWTLSFDAPNGIHVTSEYTLDRDTGSLVTVTTMRGEVGWQSSTATCRKASKVF